MDVQARPAPPYHPREVLRELWDRFPIWFLYIQSIGLLHFVRANVPERMFAAGGVTRSGICLTPIVPLSLVTAYYLLRAVRSKGIRSVPLTAAIVLLFTAGLPLFIYFIYKGVPTHEITERQLITIFEYSQIVWFAVFLLHTGLKKGWAGIVLFWLVAMLYGIVLENGGIILGFFFEGNFTHYVYRLPAPICTMFGWVLVMYVCTAIAEEFAALLPHVPWTPFRLAVVTTAAALAFDLQLDPMASLSGIWWRWNDALPPRWFGVPMINYVAWFSAVLPFAYWYFRVQARPEWAPMMRSKQLFLHLHVALLVAGVLNFGIMAVYEAISGQGFLTGPTYRILDAFFDKILPYG